MSLAENPTPPELIQKAKDAIEWRKMIRAQRKIANTPIPEDEAREYHQKISQLSPEDLLRPFDI